MKELKSLRNFVDGRQLKYDQPNKDRFKEIGLAVMRKLAKKLKLREFEASFNPGGIAVTGDLHLMGMFNDSIGIYIQISQSCFGANFECMFRTIANMKDYSGGSNNWAKAEREFLKLPESIYRICRINPADLVGVKSINLVKAAGTIKQKAGRFKQKEYDEIYLVYQSHFDNGNYFGVNGNSSERINDLTLATLAYKKSVKTIQESKDFLYQKFTFTGGKGTIERLLSVYRDSIWGIFNQLSGRYDIEELWMHEEFEEQEEI